MIEIISYSSGLVTFVMISLWLWHLRLKNAAVVDIGWAGNFGMVALVVLFATKLESNKLNLLGGMVIIWSFRLAYYLFRRTLGQPEEGRYLTLRKKWGKNIEIKFLFFYLFQGSLNILLSLPLFLAANDANPDISALQLASLLIWLVGLTGESIADRQLQLFKSDPANQGSVCNVGLWHYSRHPNYFFEWLVWVSYFIFVLDSPYGYLSIICPALMLFFLLRVTGIPATEEQSIKSKGARYRHYQKTTPAFFPWFPKKHSSAQH